jgi:hypothetical protein
MLLMDNDLTDKGECQNKDVGIVISQDAQSVGARPSNGSARHGDDSEHGTAQETGRRMVESVSDIPCQLRVPS